MCENAVNQALRRLKYGSEQMTAHGFRWTASTLLNECGQVARAFMYSELGVQPVVAGVALLDQCRLGFVTGRAVVMQQATRAEHVNDWSDTAREWDIPEWFWQRFTERGSSSQDWERGVFAGKGSGTSGVR